MVWSLYPWAPNGGSRGLYHALIQEEDGMFRKTRMGESRRRRVAITMLAVALVGLIAVPTEARAAAKNPQVGS
ncbi:MAG: hypothetical protein AAF961_14895, partial [Planctomycetota bacterium]